MTEPRRDNVIRDRAMVLALGDFFFRWRSSCR
jgi:hypothetical protein